MLWTAGALNGQQDPRAIVRESVSRDQVNFEQAKDYTYLERVERHDLDSSGRQRSTEIDTYDITILDGSPYRRLIARNDQPLSPEEDRKAGEKFDKTVRKRESESASQRAKRKADREKERQESREFLKEVPDAFEFRLVGEELLDGQKVWVIDAEPRPGYRPHAPHAEILKKFRGRLWIEQNSYQWVKMDSQVIDTVSFGLFLARLAKGTRIEFLQSRVNDEIWLPRQVHVRLDARLALLKHLSEDVDVTYSNYRKFRAESRVVAAGEESR